MRHPSLPSERASHAQSGRDPFPRYREERGDRGAGAGEGLEAGETLQPHDPLPRRPGGSARSPQKPKVFQIKIEIGLPRRQPIVVCHEREGSHANEELPLAIRDAFAAALRKVDDVGTKITARPKLERGRRRPRSNGHDSA
jgi:hypothetical protein